MTSLSIAARDTRVATYKSSIMTKLGSLVISVGDKDKDLVSSTGAPMTPLNGEILLEKEYFPDGRLKGVVSVSVDALASMLPDIKVDRDNKLGWKKHLDMFKADKLDDILQDVSDPDLSEYSTL